ncbi:uncharacterized protein LOC6579160 isoform X19 [Drosophila mojavensis]|uniref:uncharacterized protein LOC6579160 isoform X19 n=1 Tax=Drosophila mojavensis TaxID=7230 RepID=UPI001CD18A75|nr:uncharacterized protein LOC6579160 isoform X19 [Drosophila mojavensis]
MDILWSVIFIGFFFIVIYFAWIVDNILHKINEERIRIAQQRNAVMPAPSALDSNLVSSSFICCPVVSSVSSHSNGYYGMVLRYIIFANTPYTLADIFGSISALELLQSSSNGAGSPEHCGAWTSAQSLR